jgi:protein ImuB
MRRILCIALEPNRKTAIAATRDKPLAPGESPGAKTLVAYCEQFSPTVGLADDRSVLLDTSGTAELFGGEAQLMARIAAQLAGELHVHGLRARMAVADTIGAAWALAWFGVGSRQMADGSEDCRHTALCPLPTALSPLPVAALRLSAAQLDWLAELGIERIEQLMRLPRMSLATRFGPEILLRLDQALGRADEAIVVDRPPPVWSSARSFEFPLDDRRQLEAAVAEQLAPLVRGLAQRHEGIGRLQCNFDCERGRRVSLAIGAYRATAQLEHLMELIGLRLEQVRLPGPVRAIGLEVSSVAALECRQQEMFDGTSRNEQEHCLAMLVDRLSSRLGWDAVTRPRLRPEAQPEYAWRAEGVVGSQCKTKRLAGGLARRVVPRPLRLAREPVPIAVISVVPDGEPHRFDAPGQQHRVARLWGPERIETGWWRGRRASARRDYYEVETVTGRRLWIFRDLNTQLWFLHGWND